VFRKILIPALLALCVLCVSCNNLFLWAVRDDGELSTDPDTRCTVTFNINGATGKVPNKQKAVEGKTITLPGGTGFDKDDFIFDGWSTANDGTGTDYSAGSSFTVTTDITLYALWAPAWTVTFDINGGTGTVPAKKKVKQGQGDSITLPSGNGLNKNGHAFGGWNTADDGTGTDYAVGASFTPIASITLYAKWVASGGVPTQYTVTFDGNGETGGSAPGNESGEHGDPITIPNKGSLVKIGHTFVGWNLESNGSGVTTYEEDDEYEIDADDADTSNVITFYAVWNAITYTIAFDGNGETGGSAPGNESGEHGDPITIPNEGSLVKTGYDFVGWNLQSNGSGATTYEEDDEYEVDAGDANASNVITLYAKWVYDGVTTFTVTFDLNGGTDKVDPSIESYTETVVPGNSLALLDDTDFEYPTCTFIGWSTIKDDAGTIVTDDPYEPTGDITLYALWEDD